MITARRKSQLWNVMKKFEIGTFRTNVGASPDLRAKWMRGRVGGTSVSAKCKNPRHSSSRASATKQQWKIKMNLWRLSIKRVKNKCQDRPPTIWNGRLQTLSRRLVRVVDVNQVHQLDSWLPNPCVQASKLKTFQTQIHYIQVIRAIFYPLKPSVWICFLSVHISWL